MALCSMFIGLSCLAGTGSNNNAVSSAERDQKIYSLTNKELASFLEVIPAGFEKQHGFNDRNEFAKATLGHIYTIVGMDAN